MNYGSGEKTTGRMRLRKLAAAALLLLACAVAVIRATASGPDQPAQKRTAAPALPAPGTYKVDTDHSFVYFGAWHHIVGLVRGRFEKISGTVTSSANPADCSVDIAIATASISTQNSKRDEDLRGPAYFDVKEFPQMTYRGRGIRRTPQGSWVMDGSLTIRGVTKVVPLTFTFKGVFPDSEPGEPARAAFHATAATRRNDFGMTRDSLSELGTSPNGPDVSIEIDVEADAVPAQ
jgi:polyisoprenoid-binding protein YceI